MTSLCMWLCSKTVKTENCALFSYRARKLRFVLLYGSLKNQWRHTVLYNWTMHAFLCFNCLLFDSSEKLSTVKDQSDDDGTENKLLIFRKLKNRYINNPILAQLNINSLRYKIIDLREILSSSETEFLSVSETEIDDSFPDAQFQIDG